MRTQKIAHRAKRAKTPPRVENTTDATRGEPLVMRARIRRAELEKALGLLPTDQARARTDIEMALAEVNQWLAGDVEHLAHVTAAVLNTWLERTKHLAEVTPSARVSRGDIRRPAGRPRPHARS